MSSVDNFRNVTQLSDVLSIANTNTGGWFWTGGLFLFFFVALITLQTYGWNTALLVASFLSMILGLLMAYADLVTFTNAMTFFGITVLMIIVIIWGNRRDN